ncbi:putative Sporulation-specific N-acetylmuramoyl-L-alanine amidase [Blattamonas nauphoetae]|uniref:Sporulation-specific N-acetylmuramoyl-L-alanine amidase n=1 Tax=Blattamonas nauphoetae TaxID=2049346 RepID=A0ABQ9X5U9_9EUKA|nr:putative Sporulation-specific N-acetylmuramoyl-L-alanine amidase [Blattamonas nauphoetae]
MTDAEQPTTVAAKSQQFAMSLMLSLTNETMIALKKDFQTKEVLLPDFVCLIEKHLPELYFDFDCVRSLVQLFDDIDVNGDGNMEWDEFMSFIIESALAHQSSLETREDFHMVTDIPLSDNINSITYIEELRTLMCCEEHSHNVILIDPKNGMQTGTLSGHTGLVTSCCYVPEWKVFVTTSLDELVSIWDAGTNKCIFYTTTTALSEDPLAQISCAWDPQFKVLFTGTLNGRINMWRFKYTKRLKIEKIGVLEEDKMLLRLLDEQKKIAKGNMELSTGPQTRKLLSRTEKRRVPMQLGFSFATSSDQTAANSQTASATLLPAFDAGLSQQTPELDLFSQSLIDGDETYRRVTTNFRESLTSENLDQADTRLIEQAQMQRSARLAELRRRGYFVRESKLDDTHNPDQLPRHETGVDPELIVGHFDTVNQIIVVPSHVQIVITAGDDGLLLLWDLEKKAVKNVLAQHERAVSCVCWHPQARVVLSGGSDNTIRISNPHLRTQHNSSHLLGHKAAICGLSPFSSNLSHQFASLSKDGNLRLWDLRKTVCISSMFVNEISATALLKSVSNFNTTVGGKDSLSGSGFASSTSAGKDVSSFAICGDLSNRTFVCCARRIAVYDYCIQFTDISNPEPNDDSDSSQEYEPPLTKHQERLGSERSTIKENALHFTEIKQRNLSTVGYQRISETRGGRARLYVEKETAKDRFEALELIKRRLHGVETDAQALNLIEVERGIKAKELAKITKKREFQRKHGVGVGLQIGPPSMLSGERARKGGVVISASAGKSRILTKSLQMNTEEGDAARLRQSSKPIRDLIYNERMACFAIAVDATVQLVDGFSGQKVDTFLFDSVITKVATDSREHKLFVGDVDGKSSATKFTSGALMKQFRTLEMPPSGVSMRSAGGSTRDTAIPVTGLSYYDPRCLLVYCGWEGQAGIEGDTNSFQRKLVPITNDVNTCCTSQNEMIGLAALLQADGIVRLFDVGTAQQIGQMLLKKMPLRVKKNTDTDQQGGRDVLSASDVSRTSNQQGSVLQERVECNLTAGTFAGDYPALIVGDSDGRISIFAVKPCTSSALICQFNNIAIPPCEVNTAMLNEQNEEELFPRTQLSRICFFEQYEFEETVQETHTVFQQIRHISLMPRLDDAILADEAMEKEKAANEVVQLKVLKEEKRKKKLERLQRTVKDPEMIEQLMEESDSEDDDALREHLFGSKNCVFTVPHRGMAKEHGVPLRKKKKTPSLERRDSLRQPFSLGSPKTYVAKASPKVPHPKSALSNSGALVPFGTERSSGKSLETPSSQSMSRSPTTSTFSQTMWLDSEETTRMGDLVFVGDVNGYVTVYDIGKVFRKLEMKTIRQMLEAGPQKRPKDDDSSTLSHSFGSTLKSSSGVSTPGTPTNKAPSVKGNTMQLRLRLHGNPVLTDEVRNQIVVGRWRAHQDVITTLQVVRRQKLLITASLDGTFALWDLETLFKRKRVVPSQTDTTPRAIQTAPTRATLTALSPRSPTTPTGLMANAEVAGDMCPFPREEPIPRYGLKRIVPTCVARYHSVLGQIPNPPSDETFGWAKRAQEVLREGRRKKLQKEQQAMSSSDMNRSTVSTGRANPTKTNKRVPSGFSGPLDTLDTKDKVTLQRVEDEEQHSVSQRIADQLFGVSADGHGPFSAPPTERSELHRSPRSGEAGGDRPKWMFVPDLTEFEEQTTELTQNVIDQNVDSIVLHRKALRHTAGCDFGGEYVVPPSGLSANVMKEINAKQKRRNNSRLRSWRAVGEIPAGPETKRRLSQFVDLLGRGETFESAMGRIGGFSTPFQRPGSSQGAHTGSVRLPPELSLKDTFDQRRFSSFRSDSRTNLNRSMNNSSSSLAKLEMQLDQLGASETTVLTATVPAIFPSPHVSSDIETAHDINNPFLNTRPVSQASIRRPSAHVQHREWRKPGDIPMRVREAGRGGADVETRKTDDIVGYALCEGSEALCEHGNDKDQEKSCCVKIFIDPGHGGSDPGACANGLRECDLVLKISKKIRTMLNQYQNVQVKFSREGDTSVSLSQRAVLANQWGANAFCSVHINAGGGTGFESYIYSARYAGDVTYQNNMHPQIMAQIGGTDRGKKSANFAVVRETNMSAILTENLFIDRAADAALLKTDAWLTKCAKGHTNGFVKHFGLKKKTSTDPTTGTYHVQSGAFASKTNADSLMARIKAAGLEASVVHRNNLYTVQCGAFASKTNADARLAALKAKGFEGTIVFY